MWNGKKKAVTFSYDDGVMQDKRLVEIFNRYNLKCTFNVNSGMMYNECIWNTHGVDVIRMTADECIKTFLGHEIAVHSLTHPDLSKLDDYMLERQIVGDKVNIERIFNQKVNGMALPGGKNDSRIEEICKQFGIQYVRGISQSESFDAPANLYGFAATSHHNNKNIFNLMDKFLNSVFDKPQIFYIWGHSYEFDIFNNWATVEELCRKISGHDDIFYGTNTDVLEPFFN